MRQYTRLRDEVSVWEEISAMLAEARELAELEDDDLRAELTQETERLAQEVDGLDGRQWFQVPFSKTKGAASSIRG